MSIWKNREVPEEQKFRRVLSSASTLLDSKDRAKIYLVALIQFFWQYLIWLQFLQSEIHNSLIAKEAKKERSGLFDNISSHELTFKFEAVVTLEGQLRSNANYGLMIESLLRNHFSGV